MSLKKKQNITGKVTRILMTGHYAKTILYSTI